jgi:O-antigen biosynthesis protein
MAFRREVLDSIGGFDVALGAGTPARAGEDTLALTLALLDGHRIAYEPAAFVRHSHREHDDALSRQLSGYGIGLTAFYTALIRHRPSTILGLAKLSRRAVAYLCGSQADHSMGESRVPKRLKRQHRRGILVGPIAYLSSVCKQIRVSRGKSSRI